MPKAASTFSRKELRDHCGWSLTQVRVHLERLVELECLAIRHGRLGSQFVYEMLFDADTPEAVAHIGLIDIAKLRHDYKTNLTGFMPGVAGQNGHLTGGDETPPPPENATPALLKSPPDGLTESHIRNAHRPSNWHRNYGRTQRLCRRRKARPSHQGATRRQRPATGHFDRSAPDALALWRDAYLESLGARNYAEGTLEGRRDALKVFLAWAAERDLTRAGQITRPILESYQRWLWRCTKANGQRLGWSTQRNRLSIAQGLLPLADPPGCHPAQPGQRTGTAPDGKAAAPGSADPAGSRTAAGRARRGRPAGHPRPGDAGTFLLDGHPAHRALPHWNCPT